VSLASRFSGAPETGIHVSPNKEMEVLQTQKQPCNGTAHYFVVYNIQNRPISSTEKRNAVLFC
jgi:hypothetical protein